jgi:hypothetical protein
LGRGCAYRSQYFRKYTLGLQQYFVIPETQYAIAVAGRCVGPLLVVFSLLQVLSAIQFDHQPDFG